MPRIPFSSAPMPAVLLGALLWLPTALAHPDPGRLDHRRADLLDEMADRLARWKTQPRASRDAPAKAQRTPLQTPTRDETEAIRPSPDRAAGAVDHEARPATASIQPDSVRDGVEQPPAPAALEPEPVVAAPARPEAAVLPAPAALPEAPTLPPPPALDEAGEADDDPSPDGAPSSLDAPLPLGHHDAQAISLAVLAETNAARARHGLPPVAAHPILDAAAIEFAEHLARTGQFGHIDLTRPGMEEPSDRVRAAGGTDVLAAENLITETWLQVDGGEQMFVVDEARHRYSRTPDGPLIPPHTTRSIARSMVQRWLESPGHRRNILDAEGRQMGFGMAWDPRAQIPSLVAVQVFQRYHPLGEGPRLR